MRLTIHCRADATLGMGHLMRVSSLCEAARSRGIEVEIALLPAERNRAEVLDGATRVWSPGAGAGEFGCLLADRVHREGSVLLLDLPEKEYRELAWIREKVRTIVTLTMFDYGECERYEDLTIFPDYVEDREELLHSPHGQVRMLAGKSYLMVPDRFFLRSGGQRRGVLVTMGGADPARITELAVAALAGAGLSDVTVAVGSANPRRDAIKSMMPDGWTLLDQGDFDFAETLARHQLAIINGGVTRYECVAAGTPFAAISLHDYQSSITKRLVDDGFGFHLGVHDRLEADGIGRAVSGILKGIPKEFELMRNRGATLVRPGGAGRILDAVGSCCKRST